MDPDYLIWNPTTPPAAQNSIRNAIAQWRGGGPGVGNAIAGIGAGNIPPAVHYASGANLAPAPAAAAAAPAPAAPPLPFGSAPPGIYAPLAAPHFDIANGLGNVYPTANTQAAMSLMIHITALAPGVEWIHIGGGMPATRWCM